MRTGLKRPGSSSVYCGRRRSGCLRLVGRPVPECDYYVPMGDSLAVGVRPGNSGNSVRNNQGYADDLYNMIRPSRPGLQLVKLGGPGETTESMIWVGICQYFEGSQLGAATTFLCSHQASTTL